MFIINTFSTCFGHHYAHLQENKTCYCTWCAALILLDVVGSSCGYCSNSNLHSARTPQRSAPQPLPSQCSHTTTQRPTTATFTVFAPYNAAPHNRYLHSARTLQRSAPQPLPSQCSHPTTQRPTTATFTVLAHYNTASHNRYQPHPAEPARHTTCSNTRLGLLKMGIILPETC